jgi:hypothetical protein
MRRVEAAAAAAGRTVEEWALRCIDAAATVELSNPPARLTIAGETGPALAAGLFL